MCEHHHPSHDPYLFDTALSPFSPRLSSRFRPPCLCRSFCHLFAILSFFSSTLRLSICSFLLLRVLLLLFLLLVLLVLLVFASLKTSPTSSTSHSYQPFPLPTRSPCLIPPLVSHLTTTSPVVFILHLPRFLRPCGRHLRRVPRPASGVHVFLDSLPPESHLTILVLPFSLLVPSWHLCV